MATQERGKAKTELRKPIFNVIFYRTEAGNEPVWEWLKGLEPEQRKLLGEDIKTAQFG